MNPRRYACMGIKSSKGDGQSAYRFIVFIPYILVDQGHNQCKHLQVSFFHDDHVHSMDPKRGNCGEYHKGRDNLDCKTSKMAFMF